jgi:hypothetical protein
MGNECGDCEGFSDGKLKPVGKEPTAERGASTLPFAVERRPSRSQEVDYFKRT